jgi:hypothetical protein
LGIRCPLRKKSANAKCYAVRPVTARGKLAIEDSDAQNTALLAISYLLVAGSFQGLLTFATAAGTQWNAEMSRLNTSLLALRIN